MTEKRFKYVRGEGFNDYGAFLSPYVVEALLNELTEENEQLKQRYDAQRDLYAQLDCVKNNLYRDYDDLKQQISTMIKELRTEKETAISSNERIRLDFAITVLEELKGDVE